MNSPEPYPANGLVDSASNLSDADWQRIAAARRLTPQRLEILKLLCGGLKLGAVGRRLGLSRSGLRHHVEKVHAALGVRHRHMVAWAVIGILRRESPPP